MTKGEWLAAVEPKRMIDWLEAQGYGALLWDFAVVRCRRIWDELPGEPFRRVIEHVEQIGIRDIGNVLYDASRALDKLERRLHKAENGSEEPKLNRQIGYGNMILDAFDQEDGASAARSISRDLLEWADDAAAESRSQAEVLRQLAPDPSQRAG